MDGPFGDYEKLAKEGHKTVNFYVNDEVSAVSSVGSLKPAVLLDYLQYFVSVDLLY